MVEARVFSVYLLTGSIMV